MLLQLTVENYRSFRDEAVLSLLAAPGVARLPGDTVEGAKAADVVHTCIPSCEDDRTPS